jgi:hypothetical protein
MLKIVRPKETSQIAVVAGDELLESINGREFY